MKKILLYLPVMLILAAGFGCSEQRKWNREQRKEMREMLRDYRQMAYLNDLTDAEFILFSDDVATALEGDYPVYATFVTMPGVEDTVQLVIVETVVEELQADARNMRHIFPYEQLVARKMLPAGLDHDQLHAFYNCLAGKVNSTFVTLLSHRIDILPLLMDKARRRFCSSISPSTKPKISGDIGKCILRRM